MAQIIDFTAAVNKRRVQAIQEVKEKQTKAAIDNCVSNMFQAAAEGDHVGVIQNITEANRLSIQAEEKPVVAYCDPSNRFEGSKYNRNMSTKEIATAIREDIKAAKQRGNLPKALKVSVRCDFFSGGSSIDAKIAALPEGVKIYTPEYIKATNNLNQPVPYDFFPKPERYTKEVQHYLDTLQVIVTAYKMDNSDSMSDYFHVNFYDHVGIKWELERDERKN